MNAPGTMRAPAQGSARVTMMESSRECAARPGPPAAIVPLAAIGPRLLAACRAFWRGLREATGDDAYERYLRHHAERHPGSTPLSRREYFAAEQRRQWSRINRCC